jgi:hypothetical protein
MNKQGDTVVSVNDHEDLYNDIIGVNGNVCLQPTK